MKCVILIAIVVTFTKSCETETQQQQEGQGTHADSSKSFINFTEVIVNILQKVENTATTARKLFRQDVVPTKETETLYDEIAIFLSDLHQIIKEPNNAYIFLKSKGIDRVLKPNMDINYPQLRIAILTILNILFEIAPVSTDAVIPITSLDNILDIFEYDDNLAIKAHALDILHKWLPNNPRVQVRLMKLKGLEPFYEQITKRNISITTSLLDLFNKILKEHVHVLKDRSNEHYINAEKLMLYKRIGLIERMSTAPVCKGLLNIFKMTWSYNNTEHEVLVLILETVKNMKQYCLKVLRGNTLAIELFSSILKYVKESGKALSEMRADEMQLVLEDYITELKKTPPKDEF